MTTFSKFAAVLAFSGLAVSHGAAPVSAGDTSALRVGPLKGIALTVGNKRAVGYYEAANNTCNLTVLLADAFSETADSGSEPVRINMAVGAGTSAQVDSRSGNSIAFACAADATSMSIQPIARLAYAAPAK